MVATKPTQKSTAMDYQAAPRSDGLGVALLSLLGFTAPEGGRLPVGVKYDSLVALRDVFSSAEASEILNIVQARISELQASRKTATARISASPSSIMAAVKSGKLSLDELKSAIAELD